MFPPGFQWDEDKNRRNIKDHGINFRDAVRVFEKPTLDIIDDRENYHEERTNSLGDLDGRIILNVTHTERNGDIRLISARAAVPRERELYREFVRDFGLELPKPSPLEAMLQRRKDVEASAPPPTPKRRGSRSIADDDKQGE